MVERLTDKQFSAICKSSATVDLRPYRRLIAEAISRCVTELQRGESDYAEIAEGLASVVSAGKSLIRALDDLDPTVRQIVHVRQSAKLHFLLTGEDLNHGDIAGTRAVLSGIVQSATYEMRFYDKLVEGRSRTRSTKYSGESLPLLFLAATSARAYAKAGGRIVRSHKSTSEFARFLQSVQACLPEALQPKYGGRKSSNAMHRLLQKELSDPESYISKSFSGDDDKPRPRSVLLDLFERAVRGRDE